MYFLKAINWKAVNTSPFIRSSSLPPPPQVVEEDQEVDKTPLVMIPYVVGVSEDIRRVCGMFGVRVTFRSGRTLCSILTRVKDTLPLEKQSGVVYQIPCSCGLVYIGETIRRL